MDRPACARADHARRGRTRLWVGRVHLWLGLVVGAVFALAGLTGAYLAFYVEIDAALDPALRRVPPATPAAYEAVHQALRAARPDLHGPWRLEIPERAGAVPARYYQTPAASRRGFAPMLAWVDPASLRVVRTAQWGETLATWAYDLHYALLLGPVGKVVMAVVGLLSLVLLVGGAWLWRPPPGKLASALTIKRAASPQRRIYDLHKTAGVYGLAQLCLVTVTGVMLAAPAWFRPALAAPAPLFQPPAITSSCTPGRARQPLDQAVAAAEAQFPGARLKWIETPGPDGVTRVNLRQAGEPSRRFPRTNVWIDACSGQVLAVRDPRRDAPGDRVLNWLHPLHSGEAGGLVGRILAAATGLGAPALFVTGLIRWRHKQRARRLTRARRTASGLRGDNDPPGAPA